MGRSEVGELEDLSVELEPMPQHMQCALEVEFLAKGKDQFTFEFCTVQCDHLFPERRLGILDEGDGLGREDGAFLVPVLVRTFKPARLVWQNLLDVSLKSFFGCPTHAASPIL